MIYFLGQQVNLNAVLSQLLVTLIAHQIFFVCKGAGVTPAQGSVKPTMGFTTD